MEPSRREASRTEVSRMEVSLTGSRTRQAMSLLWRSMKMTPRTYVLAVGSSALWGAVTVGVSQAIGWATSTVVVPALEGQEAARGRIWQAAVLLVVTALGLACGVWGRRVWAGWGNVNIAAVHRRRLTAAYLRLPMSWHKAHPTGQLLAHASADVDAATGVFNPLPFALGVVVMVLVATIMLLATDVWLAAAALIIIPAAIVANYVYQSRMGPAVAKAQRLRAQVSDVAHESFEAALLVKALGTAAAEEAKFGERAQDLRAANTRVGIVRAIFDPVVDILPNIGTLLVIGVGTYRAAQGYIDVGAVVTASYLLTLMTVPMRAFGWVLGELPRALVGYERIARVVDTPSNLPPGSRDLPQESGGLPVCLDKVSVQVPTFQGQGSVVLLDQVSMSVKAGHTVAIVGPTGSGKTTLVSLLARLSDPTSGSVSVGGIDLRELAQGQLPSQVAFVTQSTFIFEDTVRGNVTLQESAGAGGGAPGVGLGQAPQTGSPRRVGQTRRVGYGWRGGSGSGERDVLAPGSVLGQNVALAQDAALADGAGLADGGLQAHSPQQMGPAGHVFSDDEVWAALRAARLDDVVRSLPGGLDAPLGERGANLSGGQRQRLAIARALIRKPRLLVLDDATSAVDPRIEREILQGFSQQATVIVVAYRMSSVALADTVVHLDSGRIVDVGTHEQLLARDPGYRDIATAYEQDAQRRADEIDEQDKVDNIDQIDELTVAEVPQLEDALLVDAPVADEPVSDDQLGAGQ